jgi:ribosomal protein S18 acetylase RimI-like enzyme
LRLCDPALRLISYYHRHGFRATWRHAAEMLWRAALQNESVVFRCDLKALNPSGPESILPNGLIIERIHSPEQIEERDWQRITRDCTPAICHRLFGERFRKGASLWLVRSGQALAGYAWTESCDRVGLCYPTAERDGYLFDVLVFPEYRGRRINPLLVNYIASHLAAEGIVHAYCDVKEWNEASLRSFRRTIFRPIGISKLGPLGRRRLVELDKPVGEARRRWTRFFCG